MTKKVGKRKFNKDEIDIEEQIVEENMEKNEDQDMNKPKLFGVATCNLGIYATEELNEEDKVAVLKKGEEIEIVGDTENAWKTKNGYVSKFYILKKYK